MYLTQALHRALQQTPDAPATIFGDRQRTYREQADRVARLAGGMRELGVRDGAPVAILAFNSDRYIEYLLAVPWADGVLNPVNIRWSRAEIVHSLRETQTTVLLVDDAFAAQVPALVEDCPGLKTVVHLGEESPPEGMFGYEDLIAGAQPVADARRGGDALAAVLYTGGTTGFPKGAMLSHRSLLASTLGTLATVPAVQPGGRVRVVDDEDNEVPRGTVGEIVCRGGNVMLGYWDRPEETAEALRGGWMHTGDAGYMDDDGYVHLVDRLKDMIITGGENVYSSEVENAVSAHPAVAACAVIGVPDARWGERVHAVIVRAPAHTAGADEIAAHCKTLIAGYKVPRSVDFVDALPLSPAGKVLKRELRMPYWKGMDRKIS